MQRVVYIAEGNVHALGLHAVHVHVDLRNARGEGGEHPGQAGGLTAIDHHPKCGARERIEAEVRAVLNHHLKTGDAAEAAHRRRREHQYESVAQFRVTRIELRDDCPSGLAGILALIKFVQTDKHRAALGRLAPTRIL